MSDFRQNSLAAAALRRFWSAPLTRIGVAGIILLLIPALYAPFLVNQRPLIMEQNGSWSMPFLRYIFAPESPEKLVEQSFNFLALYLPLFFLLCLIKKIRVRRIFQIAAAIALLVPFFTIQGKMERIDYRAMAARGEIRALFAAVPYGPFESCDQPFAPPSRQHIFGCDDIGRDVAGRLICGARVSLAVGLTATFIALVLGTAAGLATGYYQGKFDLFMMRLVEILMCFPTFLLLLILMSLLSDYNFTQSIPLLIGVIGLTGWIGPALLVRGEVLKQSALPYVKSCVVSGLPTGRILFRHLLPNILPPLLISFTFGIAGAILSESGLSFLGFGVQMPTASWGNLLRQAFDNPLDHWHLTVFPGAALFIAVISFNFTGEGLRRALAPEKVS